ncbi:hypothetical protein [Mycolicibacterium thermoresistibile]
MKANEESVTSVISRPAKSPQLPGTARGAGAGSGAGTAVTAAVAVVDVPRLAWGTVVLVTVAAGVTGSATARVRSTSATLLSRAAAFEVFSARSDRSMSVLLVPLVRLVTFVRLLTPVPLVPVVSGSSLLERVAPAVERDGPDVSLLAALDDADDSPVLSAVASPICGPSSEKPSSPTPTPADAALSRSHRPTGKLSARRARWTRPPVAIIDLSVICRQQKLPTAIRPSQQIGGIGVRACRCAAG